MVVESRQNNNHSLKLLGTLEYLLSCDFFLIVGPTFWHLIRNEAVAKKKKRKSKESTGNVTKLLNLPYFLFYYFESNSYTYIVSIHSGLKNGACLTLLHLEAVSAFVHLKIQFKD